MKEPCFTLFNGDVNNADLPSLFTCPFYYTPHPLSLLAVQELQELLEQQSQWQHDFSQSGKMFGVLVVLNKSNELGYLTAYSGKLTGQPCAVNFVPSVFNMYDDDTWYAKEQAAINSLNDELNALENNTDLEKAKNNLETIKAQEALAYQTQRQTMTSAKQVRKDIREQATATLTGSALADVLATLSQESVQNKTGKNKGKRSIWFNGRNTKKQLEHCKPQFEKYIAENFNRLK